MYPTKEEIINNIKKQPPTTLHITLVNDWKQAYYFKKWNKLKKEEKQQTIYILLQNIWARCGTKQTLKIIWDKTKQWSHNPDTNTITGTNPSIVSALHEIGHALFGASELTVCTYSIGLFKTCFPKEYGRLNWEGHMLLKINNNH